MTISTGDVNADLRDVRRHRLGGGDRLRRAPQALAGDRVIVGVETVNAVRLFTDELIDELLGAGFDAKSLPFSAGNMDAPAQSRQPVGSEMPTMA